MGRMGSWLTAYRVLSMPFFTISAGTEISMALSISGSLSGYSAALMPEKLNWPLRKETSICWVSSLTLKEIGWLEISLVTSMSILAETAMAPSDSESSTSIDAFMRFSESAPTMVSMLPSTLSRKLSRIFSVIQKPKNAPRAGKLNNANTKVIKKWVKGKRPCRKIDTAFL